MGSARQDIIELLREGPRSAREISQALAMPERDVYLHLAHVKQGLSGAQGERLVTQPARCLACGFSFRKRERVTVPSRCPLCRGEHIAAPLFSVEARQG